jgi:predicted DNA-binding protein with PD1-like motif
MTKTYVFRLLPGQDLKKEIQAFADKNNIEAGWICTCVGSLTDFHLRFANKKAGTKGSGFFEIVSLSGTVSRNGSHLHISISDGEGKTIGGHLLEGNIIYTTAEIVLQATDEFLFTRENDNNTGYPELKVERKKRIEP